MELKSEAQLDQQTLHRVRSRLVGARTALINQLRGMLLERGITVAQGRRKLELHLVAMMAEATGPLGARIRLLIEDMRAQWRELDRRITALDEAFAARARSDEAARRLASIPGIGVLNATALTAAIGNGEAFGRARDLAAWLGLVPKQMTTGGKPRLLGISKRGNVYLRTLLIQGCSSRVAVPRPKRDAAGRLAPWPAGAGAPEHRCGGAGQQAGADRVGCTADRPERRGKRRRGRLAERLAAHGDPA